MLTVWAARGGKRFPPKCVIMSPRVELEGGREAGIVGELNS